MNCRLIRCLQMQGFSFNGRFNAIKKTNNFILSNHFIAQFISIVDFYFAIHKIIKNMDYYLSVREKDWINKVFQ